MAGMAVKGRSATLNTEDLEKSLTENDSVRTKISNEMAVRIIKTYLREKELPENFEEASASSLDDQLSRFNAEVRQVNGEKKTKLHLSLLSGMALTGIYS